MPDPRGGVHCFLCLKKIWTPPIGTYSALKIVKNEIKLKILWPLKVEGVKNSKNKTTKCYKGWFPNTNKILLFALLLLKFKDNLWNSRWHSYNTLNHLEWIKNKKVMKFESMMVLKRKKKKQMCFLNWKVYFSSCYFFIIYFPLHLKDDF